MLTAEDLAELAPDTKRSVSERTEPGPSVTGSTRPAESAPVDGRWPGYPMADYRSLWQWSVEHHAARPALGQDRLTALRERHALAELDPQRCGQVGVREGGGPVAERKLRSRRLAC